MAMAMAMAEPAARFTEPSLGSSPRRGGSNKVRHAQCELVSVAVWREARSGGSGKRRGGEEQWERCRRSCASRARVTCIGGDMNKRDAARKALEAALGEKKDTFSKWDEEIKKREAGGGSGGGGGGRGRGWGSGGGGGDAGSSSSSSSSDSWEEPKQILLAFTGLAALYLVLTQGKSMLAFTVNSILYVLRGFKGAGSAPRQELALGGPVGRDGPGPAESSVMSKWGKD